MAAIYHIMKNGELVAVTSMGTASDTGYFGGYNEFEKQVDKKNPRPGDPLPPGNWRGSSKAKGSRTGKK